MDRSAREKASIPAQKQPTHFDYAMLDVQTARGVRVSEKRIRQLVKRSLDDIITIGAELISVKQSLPHGLFGP